MKVTTVLGAQKIQASHSMLMSSRKKRTYATNLLRSQAVIKHFSRTIGSPIFSHSSLWTVFARKTRQMAFISTKVT